MACFIILIVWLGLLCAAIYKDANRECPKCDTSISVKATICPVCGSSIEAEKGDHGCLTSFGCVTVVAIVIIVAFYTWLFSTL